MKAVSLSLLVGAVLSASGCSGGGGDRDSGVDASCPLTVAVGTGDRDAFAPLAVGDPVEVVLGFQGFRMLQLAVRVGGAPEDTVEISTYLAVPETGVEVSQRDRLLRLAPTPDGAGVVEDYLVFLNDTPASEVVGRDAELELVVRSGSCVGGGNASVVLRDDDGCVDTTIVVPDAGNLDAGLPDGAMACEDGG